MWHDTNGNGVQDAGEPGLGGVTVELRQGSTVITTVITDASGNYVFTNVVPGTYTVVFQKPSGYTFVTITNQDSKVIDFVTGSTSTITVTSGQTITTIDAGLYQGVSGDCCSGPPKIPIGWVIISPWAMLHDLQIKVGIDGGGTGWAGEGTKDPLRLAPSWLVVCWATQGNALISPLFISCVQAPVWETTSGRTPTAMACRMLESPA